MESVTGCRVCETIAKAMADWSNGLLQGEFRVPLGTWAQLERTVCETCKSVVQLFKSSLTHYPFRPSCRLEFARFSFNERFCITSALLCGRDSDDRCEDAHFPLTLIPSAASSPTMEHYLHIDPHWLDIQRLRRWPSYCDQKHHGSCHTLSDWETVSTAPSLILINVEKQHLVQVLGPARYATLSYVWGKVPDVLETTHANFQELQHDGALLSASGASRLPATVRDAMHFTRLMGLQYLWVDRLCVIQDDLQHAAEQLSRMSAIYANSYFTIIVTDGDDANHGLPGACKACPGSAPRCCQQLLLNFSANCSMMLEPESESQYRRNKWHQRGWTFQERTLSNRNFVFHQQKVFWECRQSVWREEIADAPDGVAASITSWRNKSHHRFSSYRFDYLRWPDLNLYQSLVNSYNNRLLTYESDAFRAISGIINVLSRSFQRGFCHGLPELYFDIGLMWRPNTPARRRSNTFPSWSWIGWEGNVTISCLMVSYEILWDDKFLNCRAPVKTYPTVSWYKVNQHTGVKCRIDNSYDYFQKMRSETSISLPSGWSRAKPSDCDAAESQYPDSSWPFRHEAVPNTEFLHPIPIPEKPLTPNPDIWGPHLQFRTSRCFLFSGPLLLADWRKDTWSCVENDFVARCLTFTLTDASGQCVGMIYANFSDPNDIVLGQRYELIVISGGSAHIVENVNVKTFLQEWKYIDKLKDKDSYEFYNVLWIERKGGVAYRKALGRVWQEAWHRHEVEEIDVVLG